MKLCTVDPELRGISGRFLLFEQCFVLGLQVLKSRHGFPLSILPAPRPRLAVESNREDAVGERGHGLNSPSS